MLDAVGIMMETARAHGFRIHYEDQDDVVGGFKRSSWNLVVTNPKNGRKLSVIQSFPTFDDYRFETWSLSDHRKPIAHLDLRAVLRKIVNLR